MFFKQTIQVGQQGRMYLTEVYFKHAVNYVVKISKHVGEHADGDDGYSAHGQFYLVGLSSSHQNTEEGDETQHIQKQPAEI